MLERTNKHPMETVELRFWGPIVNKTRAIGRLKNLGCVDTSDSVPWPEAFPEYREEGLPGVSLLGARTKEEMTQTRHAELTGIPQRHLSMMEHGKRVIGKKNAHLLGKVLKGDYRVLL